MVSRPGTLWHILIFATVTGAIIASLILFVRAFIYFDERRARQPKGTRGGS